MTKILNLQDDLTRNFKARGRTFLKKVRIILQRYEYSLLIETFYVLFSSFVPGILFKNVSMMGGYYYM